MSSDFATEVKGHCALCQTPIGSATARYCVACYKKCLHRCPECTSMRGVVLHKYQVHDGSKATCRRCGVQHDDRRRLACNTCNNERTIFVLPEEKDAKVS